MSWAIVLALLLVIGVGSWFAPRFMSPDADQTSATPAGGPTVAVGRSEIEDRSHNRNEAPLDESADATGPSDSAKVDDPPRTTDDESTPVGPDPNGESSLGAGLGPDDSLAGATGTRGHSSFPTGPDFRDHAPASGGGSTYQPPGLPSNNSSSSGGDPTFGNGLNGGFSPDGNHGFPTDGDDNDLDDGDTPLPVMPNAGPSAFPRVFSVTEGQTLIVPAPDQPGLLDQQFVGDPENDPLKAFLDQAPSNGDFDPPLAAGDELPDGAFRYMPKSAKPDGSPDIFTYYVQDDQGHRSAAAEVQIYVIPNSPASGENVAPIAIPSDKFHVEVNSRLVVQGRSAQGYPGLDPNGDEVTVILVNGPKHGSFDPSIGPNGLSKEGAFSYTPMRDFQGEDQFTFKLFDGNLDSQEVTCPIFVGLAGTPSDGTDEDCQGPNNELKRLSEFPKHKQPDGIGCGPTAAQMVLGYYHVTAGLGPLKTSCNTRWLQFDRWKINIGLTLPEGIAKGLKDYGVPASVKTGQSLEDLLRYVNEDRPPIILVRSGEFTWHYVVVVGYKCGTTTIRVVDPGSGAEDQYDGATLDAAWSFAADLAGERVTRDELPCPESVQPKGIRKCIDGKAACLRCKGLGGIDGQKLGLPVHVDCPDCRDGATTHNCPVCFGRGRMGGDIARQAVEGSGVAGYTLIVPDAPPVAPVAVPKLVGLTWSAAFEALNGVGLRGASSLGEVSGEYVYDQSPRAGTLVAPNRVVTLEPGVRTPSVVRMTLEAARETLAAANLNVQSFVTSTVSTSDPELVGQTLVKSQDPESPAIAKRGERVTLRLVSYKSPTTSASSGLRLTPPAPSLNHVTVPPPVASGPSSGPLSTVPPVPAGPALVAVPQVVNRAVSDAIQILRSAGFRPELEFAGALPDDIVRGQRVEPRRSETGWAPIGSTVVLGPVLRRVPNVTGKRWDEAEKLLRQRRLQVAAVPGARRDSRVVSQWPTADQLIDPTTSVRLVTAAPPPPVPAPRTQPVTTWTFVSHLETLVRCDLSADRKSVTTNLGGQGRLVGSTQLGGEPCLEFAISSSRGQIAIVIPVDGTGPGKFAGTNVTFQTTPPVSPAQPTVVPRPVPRAHTPTTVPRIPSPPRGHILIDARPRTPSRSSSGR